MNVFLTPIVAFAATVSALGADASEEPSFEDALAALTDEQRSLVIDRLVVEDFIHYTRASFLSQVFSPRDERYSSVTAGSADLQGAMLGKPESAYVAEFGKDVAKKSALKKEMDKKIGETSGLKEAFDELKSLLTELEGKTDLVSALAQADEIAGRYGVTDSAQLQLLKDRLILEDFIDYTKASFLSSVFSARDPRYSTVLSGSLDLQGAMLGKADSAYVIKYGDEAKKKATLKKKMDTDIAAAPNMAVVYKALAAKLTLLERKLDLHSAVCEASSNSATYRCPVISEAASNPTTSDKETVTLTISGVNFPALEKPKVMVGSTQATVTSFSDTQVVVSIPLTAVTGGIEIPATQQFTHEVVISTPDDFLSARASAQFSITPPEVEDAAIGDNRDTLDEGAMMEAEVETEERRTFWADLSPRADVSVGLDDEQWHPTGNNLASQPNLSVQASVDTPPTGAPLHVGDLSLILDASIRSSLEFGDRTHHTRFSFDIDRAGLAWQPNGIIGVEGGVVLRGFANPDETFSSRFIPEGESITYGAWAGLSTEFGYQGEARLTIFSEATQTRYHWTDEVTDIDQFNGGRDEVRYGVRIAHPDLGGSPFSLTLFGTTPTITQETSPLQSNIGPSLSENLTTINWGAELEIGQPQDRFFLRAEYLHTHFSDQLFFNRDHVELRGHYRFLDGLVGVRLESQADIGQLYGEGNVIDVRPAVDLRLFDWLRVFVGPDIRYVDGQVSGGGFVGVSLEYDEVEEVERPVGSEPEEQTATDEALERGADRAEAQSSPDEAVSPPTPAAPKLESPVIDQKEEEAVPEFESPLLEEDK
ncbi:MAG: IPT/TIG domain-containing protein [bacterium]